MDKVDYISVFGSNLHFKYINEDLLNTGKPLLVFLHEGLGSIAQWGDFPSLLCNRLEFPALLYDREGHGKSDELKSPREWDFMHIQAQKVLPEVFRVLGLEANKKILIGHSDGGSIAIIHAGSFPENILGIITEASHQFIEPVSVKGIRSALRLFEEGKLNDLLYKFHGEKTSAMFHGWADTWLQEKFLEWNIEEYVEKIKVPFLGIQGKNDRYGSYAQLEKIKSLAENSEICFIERCGHIPHLQHKEKLIQIMSDFIIKLL